MKKEHTYHIGLHWTGNQGQGTRNYKAYQRSYTVSVEGKPDIHGSSDPLYRGDKSKYNPEDLFLASIASCHMLWYLHLCADAGITVHEYLDQTSGTVRNNADGSGHFIDVTLHPRVGLENLEHESLATQLHQEANKFCLIANSCNFVIRHKPTFFLSNNK
ncbi:MAG TPA: OsmC family protein [Membranihabitans sp.]|nr:OsmC family protein [Membranihabitans sp.]